MAINGASGGSAVSARGGLEDAGKLLLRLFIGGNMLLHGIAKVQHGVGEMKPLIASKGLPEFITYGVYVGEVLAPILLIIGLFTRIAGLLVAFTMVMAVGLVHMGDIATLTKGGGWGVELQSMYFFGGMAIFCLGAGRYAVSRGRFWM